MKRTNTIALLLLFLCLPPQMSTAHNEPVPIEQLPELPVAIYWDDSGLKIRLKRHDSNTASQLRAIPSRYLEKVGNDLINVNKGGNLTPIVIDLSKYFENKMGYRSGYTRINNNEMHTITVEKDELSGSNYDEYDTFAMVLKYPTGRRKIARQEILFKGLDVFRVEADQRANVQLSGKKIIVDVSKTATRHLILRGGVLQLDDIEELVPNLCQKYNKKFGEDGAFIFSELEGKGDKSWNLDHVRNLITKYNITDFNDEPLAYLKNIIITKKGIGFDLKRFFYDKRNKPKDIAALDSYLFFDWSTFINMKFAKSSSTRQFVIQGPYANTYLYSGNEFFTNVELIQFMNELTYSIAAAMD